MKAIVSRTYGAPDEVMRLEVVDPPAAGPDDIVVNVRAASPNPADWHVLRGDPYVARASFGLRRPSVEVLGSDAAGVVESVGERVTSFAPGDEVVGCTFMAGFGAFAEQVRVPADRLAAKPAGLSFEEAAAMPLAALTALQALRDEGGVRTGQRVLIIGASGGVGTFAVQIAKVHGAEVTGVSSTRNLDLVRSLGADHMIDYTTQDLASWGGGYDVVIQVSGELSPWAARRLLTPKGTLVLMSGDSDGHVVGPIGRIVAGRLLSPFVGQRISALSVDPNRADLLRLTDLVESGAVSPVLDRSYALAETPEAMSYLETGRARGKVVITV